jgi:tetratricopeptide (TPR) repeat protein
LVSIQKHPLNSSSLALEAVLLFNLLLSGLVVLSPELEILEKVPGNWYRSTTELFNYCVDVQFNHPICPRLRSDNFGEVDFASEFFRAPTGELNSRSLFQATVLYQVGRPPTYWFVGLNLEGERPQNIDARLWAEAQWLWARILFDQRDYAKSLEFFDKVVDEFRGRALVHQQRAWAQFFTRKFDVSLGSIVSAESPLIYPVPFFEKYFLRALVEKESCLYEEALKTIAAGRAALNQGNLESEKHPWVVLCQRRNLGTLCMRLESWFEGVYQRQAKRSINDLDLLEIELGDRLTGGQGTKSESSVMWPKRGEAWRDELGRYSVPVENKC